MGNDAQGYRKLFGVLGPSTNTIVQPDFDDMRPHGVTNHYSRIYTPNSRAVSDETFMAATQKISQGVIDAVRSVMTCHPDYLVMGMSAITFFDGQKGADKFVTQVKDVSGLDISIGSHSCTAALNAFGGIRRLAVLSPYWPVMNAEVARYFGDMGFTVVRDIALECRSWTGIAQVTPAECVAALKRLDGDDVDAIVQVGTNLSMIRVAAMAELWLGKPVLAINAATYWHALRANGIAEKIAGCGRIFEEF